MVKFSPPFTLYDLSLSIKSHFKLSGNVELLLWNEEYRGYVLVKLVTEIKHKSKLRVSPSSDNLWSQIPNKPWVKVLPSDTSSQVVIREVKRGAILDQELWGKLVALLEKMSPGFDVSVISKAIAINNANLKSAFEAARTTVAGKHGSAQSLFKATSWQKIGSGKERCSRDEEDRNQRYRFIDFLQTYVNQFGDNQNTSVPSLFPSALSIFGVD